MTIVGFEQKKDGSKNLIVFDPMFHDNANVLRLVGNDNFRQKYPEDMLRAYRRGVKYLKKYNGFEILRYVVIFRGRCDEGGNEDEENEENKQWTEAEVNADESSRLTPPESLKGDIEKGS